MTDLRHQLTRTRSTA